MFEIGLNLMKIGLKKHIKKNLPRFLKFFFFFQFFKSKIVELNLKFIEIGKKNEIKNDLN